MKSRSFTPSQIRYLRGRAEEQYENMRGSRAYRNVEFFIYILIVVLAALVIRSFIAEPIRVEGDSMIPTLYNTEDMLVEKVSYWFSDPLRGDIVICYYPGYTESCVKRVIGLPGETVSVVSGDLYINGEYLDESVYWNGEIIGDMDPVRLARGKYSSAAITATAARTAGTRPLGAFLIPRWLDACWRSCGL